MNGFLVMLWCNFDDVPIRLCETYAEAEYAVKNYTEKDLSNAREVLGRDETDLVSGAIVEFRDGYPYGECVLIDIGGCGEFDVDKG